MQALSYEERSREFTFTQQDENEIAQMVVLNEPALANWMGSIHPNGSLYELPLNVKAAQEEHLNFRRELERNGCLVMTVREILLKDAETDVVARVKLEELAFAAIKYVLVEEESGDQVLTERDKFLLSDEYKRQAIDKMNAEQLVEVVLTNPTIYLQKADKDTELLATNYSFQPLVNLVFCRDQQITTRNGLVIANLSSPIRERETRVMRFCFTKLGVPIIGEIPAPGKLEGGDFFPVGKDLCMIGVGLRSNMFAIRHLLDNDLFGTTRVAVVKDYFDQDQQRMHLDTVFNVLKPRCALILETIMGESSPLRRLVDEYTKGKDGKYKLTRHDVEFTKYLADQHTALIPVSEQNQIDYGCNGVNLGNGNLIMVDKATAKVLARSPYFDGKITVIDFRNMTDMYGSVHCCSQVISRRRGSDFAGPDAPARLCKAAADGEIEIVKRLVAAGVDLNGGDYDRRTALHLSASENRLNVVLYLLAEGAEVNAFDRWEHTPLDDAVRLNYTAVVEALRKSGGKTSQEVKEENAKAISEAIAASQQQSGEKEELKVEVVDRRNSFAYKRQNSTARALLVTPSNFDTNPQTATTNAFMKDAAAVAANLTRKSGRREMRKALLHSTEQLHKVLTVDLGVEVYLFNHETFENCPEAVFVQDWFSTHPAEELGEPTLILYPMLAPNRRTERRPWILDFLLATYPRVINLTNCEKGQLEVTNTADTKVDTTVYPEGRYLEFGALTLNRKTMTAFCAISERAHKEVIPLWEKATGYEVVAFDTEPFEGQKIHHTSHVLFIGTGYAIVSPGLIAEHDRARVLDRLRADGLTLIELKKEQAFSYVAQAAEFPTKSGGRNVLLLPTTGLHALHENQLAALKEFVDIKDVELSTLEVLGGGSLGSIINQLF